jgi:predicted metallo-beta-lactamase superfamily hydrolase
MTLEFEPIWFDSMGAKSMCTRVSTPDISLVIDPGVSEMQPSFPASEKMKTKWLKTAEDKIRKRCRNADIIVISHYHYDHYFYDDFELYNKKTVLIKNPNKYINLTQRNRAVTFFENLEKYYKIQNEEKKNFKNSKIIKNPLNELPIAINKDFGSYNKRRKEVLKKGNKRYDNLASKWETFKEINEFKSDNIETIFPESKTFIYGDTKLRFTSSLFHGIEFATVGWVFSTIVEYKHEKFFYSSDLSGPMIEDYAEMIIKENPSILILDGPTTYLFGYILNRINLERTINNTQNIIKKINPDVFIYDHHLTREARFRERTKNIWKTSRNLKKKIETAAEFLGTKTVVELKN